MSSGNIEHYACKCLNVGITASPSSSPPPDYPRDSNYTPVFIQEGGISVTHPQVTVRVPLKAEPLPGSSRYSRFTLLTCLFCSLPIYRVYNIVSLEVEGPGVTLLPSEDWVEHEILKSATGWIDVHNDSLRGNTVLELLKSPSYSSTFSLSLSPTHSSPPPSPIEEKDDLVTEVPQTDETLKEYLEGLRPLFLPPPFTSSHPIFVHLADLATKKSQELRSVVERRIADFIKAETAGLEREEKVLKQQVEVLWKSFKHNLDSFEIQRRVSSNTGRSLSRSHPSKTSHLSSSVTIRDFTPQSVISAQRSVPSKPSPQVSALSASLATSKFYHPKEIQEPSSSQSLGSNTSVLTRSTPSRTTVPRESGNILVDGNTASSLNYFVTLAEDRARYKEAQEQTLKKQQEEETAKRVVMAETSSNAVPNTVASSSGTPQSEAQGSSRSRDKGKKVVTFVEPTPTNAPEEKEEVMIFPYEPEQLEDASQPSAPPQDLLLTEPKVFQPLRPSRRNLNKAAHEAFTALRPSSLPAPSHIRPMRSQPGVDSFSQNIIPSLSRAMNGGAHTDARRASPPPSSRPLTENETALMKLVAADIPSHRGAWRLGSRAWQNLTRRRSSVESSETSDSPEEGEDASKPNAISIHTKVATDNDDSTKVACSMPVNIVNRFKPKEQLSLSSYLPPSTILETSPKSTEVGTLSANNKPLSSTAIRKALYSERDRKRAMDPGALDFPLEEEDEEESHENEIVQVYREAGEQGRQHALKIIQARDELPSEGMWRSLA